jgi:hypothetical protein
VCQVVIQHPDSDSRRCIPEHDSRTCTHSDYWVSHCAASVANLDMQIGRILDIEEAKFGEIDFLANCAGVFLETGTYVCIHFTSSGHIPLLCLPVLSIPPPFPPPSFSRWSRPHIIFLIRLLCFDLLLIYIRLILLDSYVLISRSSVPQ